MAKSWKSVRMRRIEIESEVVYFWTKTYKSTNLKKKVLSALRETTRDYFRMHER